MSRTRKAFLVLFLLAATPAAAQEYMNATAARSFVAGRLFSYSCFDGTIGAGRIFNDGSVAGTIRVFGQGPVRYLRLPEGTLYERGERICARLNGLFFEPCFNLTRTDEKSFRGAVSGLGFMYCDFNRGEITQLARKRAPRKRGAAAADKVLAGSAPSTP